MKPVKPVKPVKPAQPAQPAQPARPAQPAQPSAALPPMPRLHLSVPALEALAEPLRRGRILADADLLVIDAVAPRYAEKEPQVLLALALALRAVRVGHAGIDLRALDLVLDHEPSSAPAAPAPQPERDDDVVGGDDEGDGEQGDGEQDDDEAEAPESPADTTLQARLSALSLPSDDAALRAWEARVLASPMVSADTRDLKPFHKQARADGSWLLLTQRMAREQERLAAALTTLANSAPVPAVTPAALEQGVALLFAKDADGESAHAVRRAVNGRLSIVTGGPGTGKTFSIKRLLALLLDAPRAADAPPLRIELAAPTGKAAVRMREALLEKLEELPLSDAAKHALESLAPRTVHKLLGMRPDGGSRHDASRPLPADLIVVDEASMVGLALMRRLVESVGAGARLVLLGDRDQLASIDAGTVLADLVHAGAANPLAPCVTRFTRSYRFDAGGAVAAVAKELQDATEASLRSAVARLVGAERAADAAQGLRHLGIPAKGLPSDAQLSALAAPYLDATTGYVGALAALLGAGGASNPALRDEAEQRRLLDRLDGYRVLAVHRRGPLGVAGLVTALGARVRTQLLDALAARARAKPGALPAPRAELPAQGRHWLGEPVLVTRNDYDVELRNGDIGLVLPNADGRLGVVFPVEVEGKRGVRYVPIERLPPHMGALAMTVHKSQGSQFQHVALVLAGRVSPIQTRELVYTGITRAKAKLDWLGAKDELEQALARPVRRASGLQELL